MMFLVTFGLGSVILATPLLLYLVGLEPHIAIGTSALAVSTNAFANFIGHARCGNVRWRCAGIFALIGALGAFAGSTLGKMVDGEHLIFLFGLLMLAVGCWIGEVRRSAFRVDFDMRVGDRLAADGYGWLVGFDYEAQEARPLPDDLRERLVSSQE